MKTKRDFRMAADEDKTMDTKQTNFEFKIEIGASHSDVLELLGSKKEKLLELVNSYPNDDAAMPRYLIGRLCVTKSVHIVTGLDILVREYSTEKNISQKDMFQIEMIEFLKRYGYRREVESLIGP